MQDWFGWDDTAANLLFTAAGVVNLLCAVAMAWLSGSVKAADGSRVQRMDDRSMLVGSMGLAMLGWLVTPHGAALEP